MKLGSTAKRKSVNNYITKYGSVYLKAYFKNIDNVKCLEISTIQLDRNV